MWKSIIYKEWIKIRWFVIVFAAVGILAEGNIFLKIQHDFAFNDPATYWYSILFLNTQFFSFGWFKFTPAVGALVVALAQFVPEIINKRIKLTFHLPVNENRILIQLMLFGTFCLFACYAILILLFLAFCNFFFPKEIIENSLISIAPWFLSGFAIYYFVALIVLEPLWLYKFLYLITAAFFIPVYFIDSITGGYAPCLPFLAILTFILSISLLFSGYRFRKGEMQIW